MCNTLTYKCYQCDYDLFDKDIVGLEQLLFVGVHGTRQVHGTGVTTGALTGSRHIYRCLLTQFGMLQCKLDVIMMTTTLFSVSNIPVALNWQNVIFTLKTVIYDRLHHLASETMACGGQ